VLKNKLARLRLDGWLLSAHWIITSTILKIYCINIEEARAEEGWDGMEHESIVTVNRRRLIVVFFF
jgi:hypothetical protein